MEQSNGFTLVARSRRRNVHRDHSKATDTRPIGSTSKAIRS
jgi:hypothetical protein